jgi:hypothetical protein
MQSHFYANQVQCKKSESESASNLNGERSAFIVARLDHLDQVPEKPETSDVRARAGTVVLNKNNRVSVK